MQTTLTPDIKDTPHGQEAEAIVRSCVHCGFCQATCPTYQLLGDELDSPRGRIYLIKQVLEGVTPTEQTQLHLDRCLTCRACETACPSGVQYGRLLDIGRKLVDDQVPRTLTTRIGRAALRGGLTGPLFSPALRVGRAVRSLLPASLRAKVPVARDPRRRPARSHMRKMILLEGCVQPAMSPNINAATARVLDRLGIELVVPAQAGCCGAIRQHLGDQDTALQEARRNIDAWWPSVEAGAEAVVMNASGCGAMAAEYGHLLRHDPAYAEKAARISALARDVAEIVSVHADQLLELLPVAGHERVVFHPPCTQQHALRIRGVVEKFLAACGAEVLPVAESHLCCGSAGTYSLLQPELSNRLRERKLDALTRPRPSRILSANIGCIAHLAALAPVPVEHWIEWLDGQLEKA